VVISYCFAGLSLIHYLALKTLISKWPRSFFKDVSTLNYTTDKITAGSGIQRQKKQAILLTL